MVACQFKTVQRKKDGLGYELTGDTVTIPHDKLARAVIVTSRNGVVGVDGDVSRITFDDQAFLVQAGAAAIKHALHPIK